MITVRPQGRFKADNGTALAAAAVAGVGIAALPDFLIDAHLASGALVRLRVPWPEGHPPDLAPFDVVEATLAVVMRPHWEQTRQTMRGQRLVLIVHDTTELDYSSYRRHCMTTKCPWIARPAGLGPVAPRLIACRCPHQASRATRRGTD